MTFTLPPVGINDMIRYHDHGLVVGVVFDTPVGGGSVEFDARVELGLTSVYSPDSALDIKNQVFSFMIGYAL